MSQEMRPGQGSPIQPGPPRSVDAPIKARDFYAGALLMWAGLVAVILLIVAAILLASRIL
jgi:hypothetical protein